MIHDLSRGLLGRHVMRRAQHESSFRQLRGGLVERLRDAEVDELHRGPTVGVGGQHQVL
jgi:hypothetical protein